MNNPPLSHIFQGFTRVLHRYSFTSEKNVPDIPETIELKIYQCVKQGCGNKKYRYLLPLNQ